jgi:hypothetical protein
MAKVALIYYWIPTVTAFGRITSRDLSRPTFLIRLYTLGDSLPRRLDAGGHV